MARDVLNITSLSNAGTTPPAQLLGVNANDIELTPANGDMVWVEIENLDSAARTVTFQTPVTYDGLAVADVDISVPAPTQASLTTACAGANNDMVFTAIPRGKAGNNITIAYVVAGLNTALSVVVTGTAIVVNVATDGAGVATSTAAQIKTALDANASAAALITSANAAANDGTGVVAAFAATPLAGGDRGVRIMPIKLLGTFLQTNGKVYIDVANDNALYFRAYRY